MSRSHPRRRKIPRDNLQASLSLLLLFPPGISASGLSFSADILGAHGSATQRTASRPLFFRCSFTDHMARPPAALKLFSGSSTTFELVLIQQLCYYVNERRGAGEPDCQSASQASRPSFARNQTIASEVTASIHQAPKASWAPRPMTTTTDSQRQATDSAASARRARLPS